MKRDVVTLDEAELVRLEQALESLVLTDEQREALCLHVKNVVAPEETPMHLGQYVFLMAQMYDISIREAYQMARAGYNAGKLKLVQ